MDPKQIFIEEATELVAELENVFLELEKNPGDHELIAQAFRSLHTIKGSGAMFGFDDIASFTHEVETVYDLVRDKKVLINDELISLSFKALDVISYLLKGEETQEDKKAGFDSVLSGFRNITKKNMPVEKKNPVENEEISASSPEQMFTYRIHFGPDRNFFTTGSDPVPLIKELRSLGICTIVANTKLLPMLTDLDCELCYTYWDIILTTNAGLNAIRDVFIFAEDSCELKIDVIDEEGRFIDETACKKIGEILIERGDISREALENVLSSQKRIGEMLIDAGMVKSESIQSALLEQEHIRQVIEKKQKTEYVSSIRVASSKLDTLVNLVGELVTVQARLNQTSSLFGNSELKNISEEIERLTEELRNNTMSIRMTPIGSTFNQFKRVVRDMAREQNKKIIMTTEGEDTELDKTVIERLHDPLMHLIRNSIDHGIELPEQRCAAGKPAQGKLNLSAGHSGANVLIKVEDDGRGLDPETIRAKALEKGMLPDEAKLSEKEIFPFIFNPGFSTAEKVTSISGRGVGMDVVKQTIDSLRGTIEVESKKGKGTVFTLKLPLTLAIIDGLLVKTGDGFFVMPLSFVEECVELSSEDINKAHGRFIANVRGEIVPYLRLRNQFFIEGNRPEIEQIVIAGVNGQRMGIVVDKVIGEYQTVIKPLGSIYRNVDSISGATILGDGTLALILDLPRLTDRAERLEQI